MSGPIGNAKNVPLNLGTGSIPNVNSAMTDWFQPITFGLVTKDIDGFQVEETMTMVNFQGVVQPYKPRDLLIKPEGQRAWTWLTLHCDPSLKLKVDDVVIYVGKQTRVMSLTNFSPYGYLMYELVQDFTGSDPTVVTP